MHIRRKIGHSLIKWGVHSLAALGRLLPAFRPSRNGYEIISNIAYSKSALSSKMLDIYKPKLQSDQPLPVIFHVHGGAFRLFSKDTHWVVAHNLVKMGFLVVNINYRLAPQHKYPSGIKDTFEAFLWTLKHVQEYGGDPERLILVGESAGGNLVTSLTLAAHHRMEEEWAQAVFDANPNILATMPCCALLQTTDASRMCRQRYFPFWIRDRILGFDKDYLAEEDVAKVGKYPLVDPLVVLESELQFERELPQFYAMCGLDDPCVDDTKRLRRVLQERGIDHKVNFYEKEGHVFHMMVWKTAAKKSWVDKKDFLQQFLEPSSQESTKESLWKI